MKQTNKPWSQKRLAMLNYLHNKVILKHPLLMHSCLTYYFLKDEKKHILHTEHQQQKSIPYCFGEEIIISARKVTKKIIWRERNWKTWEKAYESGTWIDCFGNIQGHKVLKSPWREDVVHYLTVLQIQPPE